MLTESAIIADAPKDAIDTNNPWETSAYLCGYYRRVAMTLLEETQWQEKQIAQLRNQLEFVLRREQSRIERANNAK